MGKKYEKQIYNLDFEKQITEDYLALKSIRKVASKAKISTRQVINILDKHNIAHNVVRKIKMDEMYFDKNDDNTIGNDVMYWAGFIAADGNVMNKSETRSYFLTIKLAQKDRNHLQKFQQCIKTTALIKDQTHASFYRLGKFWKETYSSTIVLNSKYLVNSLSKYNIIPNKTKTYQFPQTLKKHKFINSFIRGYLDGDGSISFKNNSLRVNFYGTQDCLTNISEIIADNCKLNLHKPFKNRSIYCIEYNGNNAINLSKWLYKNQKTYLSRKYNLIKDIIK